ncbi:MAG: hypothetical protein GY866_13805, partial [Proteobacteria bacterium]|nr:hypothetical protein [Pseudomonadota bacterium]
KAARKLFARILPRLGGEITAESELIEYDITSADVDMPEKPANPNDLDNSEDATDVPEDQPEQAKEEPEPKRKEPEPSDESPFPMPKDEEESEEEPEENPVSELKAEIDGLLADIEKQDPDRARKLGANVDNLDEKADDYISRLEGMKRAAVNLLENIRSLKKSA